MSFEKEIKEELLDIAKEKTKMEIGTDERFFKDGYEAGLEKSLKIYKNSKPKTEDMVEEIIKVAKTVQQINKSEFSKKMLILYINDKTKLGKQKAEMILDVIEEFGKEMGN